LLVSSWPHVKWVLGRKLFSRTRQPWATASTCSSYKLDCSKAPTEFCHDCLSLAWLVFFLAVKHPHKLSSQFSVSVARANVFSCSSLHVLLFPPPKSNRIVTI
jgi:hypothetical protein